jgi:hypothetical protein
MLVIGLSWIIRGKCSIFRRQVEDREARVAGILFVSAFPLFLIVPIVLREVLDLNEIAGAIASSVVGLVFVVSTLFITGRYVVTATSDSRQGRRNRASGLNACTKCGLTNPPESTVCECGHPLTISARSAIP